MFKATLTPEEPLTDKCFKCLEAKQQARFHLMQVIKQERRWMNVETHKEILKIASQTYKV